jgi:serine/threonine protein kinase
MISFVLGRERDTIVSTIHSQPENILIESSYDVYTGLKLADFGSCRGIRSKQVRQRYDNKE